MSERFCLASFSSGCKLLVAAAALTLLQGCAMFVAERRAPDDDLVTGSITPHPVAGVSQTNLAPLSPVARVEPGAVAPMAAPPAAPPLPQSFAALPPRLAPPSAMPTGPMISEADREAVRRTLEAALLDREQAVRTPWLNSSTGIGGLIVPASARSLQGEAVCRNIRISVIRPQRTEWLSAQGCLPNGGDWALVDVKPGSAPEG